MTEFRSFKDLEKFLKNAIDKSIKDSPPQAVKKVMLDHIQEDVYDVYELPLMYSRREEAGGLSDERNITVKNRRNSRVEIYNVTKRNLNYANQYLAPVIEFGHKGAMARGYRGYSYPYPQFAYYYPRPFIKNTRNDLSMNQQHIDAFKKSLKKFGVNTE